MHNPLTSNIVIPPFLLRTETIWLRMQAGPHIALLSYQMLDGSIISASQRCDSEPHIIKHNVEDCKAQSHMPTAQHNYNALRGHL